MSWEKSAHHAPIARKTTRFLHQQLRKDWSLKNKAAIIRRENGTLGHYSQRQNNGSRSAKKSPLEQKNA
jgi:hypothetical protein